VRFQSKPDQIRVIAWPAFRNRGSNPYNFLLYSHLEKLGVTVLDLGEVIRSPKKLWEVVVHGVEILHLHWPEYALSLSPLKALAHLGLLFASTIFCRLRGGKVVWTVHNLSPHENRYPSFEGVFYQALSRVTDGLIFLTQTSYDIFRKEERMRIFWRKPNAVIPHGSYAPLYPAMPTQEEARRELGLPGFGKVVLFFGAVRPYKGVEEVLGAAAELSNQNIFFVLSGKPLTEAYKRELMRKITSSNVRVYFEHIPEEKVPSFFAAADLVVLPYKRILNSGSAFLALTFGKPILAPRQGSLIELEQHYPSLVHLYEDAPLDAEKILDALERSDLNKHKALLEWKDMLLNHDWIRIAEQTLLFYKKLLKGEI